MCPDWGRSQLPSTEISFLGKLFQKLPTMDFSARTAKASGLGRETTEEEESWKPLVGGSPFFSASCRTAAVRDARGANPKAEGGITLPAFHTACWKELAINLLLAHTSLTSPLHSKNPPLQQGMVTVGGDPAQAALCTPPDALKFTARPRSKDGCTEDCHTPPHALHGQKQPCSPPQHAGNLRRLLLSRYLALGINLPPQIRRREWEFAKFSSHRPLPDQLILRALRVCWFPAARGGGVEFWSLFTGMGR